MLFAVCARYHIHALEMHGEEFKVYEMWAVQHDCEFEIGDFAFVDYVLVNKMK